MVSFAKTALSVLTFVWRGRDVEKVLEALMQTLGDSAMSLMCQKVPVNVSRSSAFVSFGIRILQHPGLEKKVEVGFF